ncbi:alpha-glucuronidase family glycosyl hydrolase [Sphingobium yanoikuyae]|uniref:alpha-glucuronidase family glycosyl hydrolase n=1 Tax=Sphingobium yanoikuyae TaxID=13690 RepID=UPI0004E36313|nr:alpha-glucuronidase family glycosyl hydrolase [Sphingobium yanoikuyae]KFD28943.1 alpha-glucuronidase [Sphingobium yanoikuyae]KZC81416.1 alpha-glucuronidase [Sphingobium yanoikuyae]MDV3478792.1 alpha-glucuronidase family glycosyl hydrolase [Sphingobium yanoikuyae]
MFARLFCWIMASVLLIGTPCARAEDGYDLWLRNAPADAANAQRIQANARSIVGGASPSLMIARRELQRGIAGLTGATVPLTATVQQGAILLQSAAQQDKPSVPTDGLGADGYAIRTMTVAGKPVTVIAGATDVGVLHGAYAWLRLARTGAALDRIDMRSAPRIGLRLLNHWDNLDGTVERGYAGQSIWDWWRLPDYKGPRYTDYARANASLGINGTVLNNVNAKSDSLTAAYIAKAAALADLFRPYGIKVYLSVKWTAPMELDGLKSADPLDPAVAAWWKAKADEIYKAIPDFGGFLVKANSEGQPGPQDYKRTHADGANMLAAAVKPHGGIVMWRAFVYAHDNPDDRAKQAYSDFKPLDGQFADNVIVQVKNGAIDFQPREPFHPLFGAMPKTPLMMEFQITKEYLGQSTHLTYLGTLFEETLKSDTLARGKGSTVAKVIDGSLEGHKLTGIAGVANIGVDRDWSGSIFNQADWYAFGRMAWDTDLTAEAVAREWAAQTFSPDPRVVAPIVAMMMGSREAAVDYMTPLGLAHIMGTGHHYGPAPWVSELARPEWNPVYYHKADKQGIGFDRTRTGSNATGQYAPALAKLLDNPKTTPERELLWFHHLPWDYRLQSGETLWDGLIHHYDRGVETVAAMQRDWAKLKPQVDAERFAQVETFLAIQHREAQWWRDACIAYFQSVSGRPLPAGSAAPAHPLDWYKALSFPYAPGHPK